jgi:hypothetical protein
VDEVNQRVFFLEKTQLLQFGCGEGKKNKQKWKSLKLDTLGWIPFS